MFRPSVLDRLPALLACWAILALINTANAVVLWSDPDTTLAQETGAGADILGGAVKRDDSANDSLYFKFHVDPLSAMDTEEYFAGFELYEGDSERLGIGNAWRAWAYSIFRHGAASGAGAASDYIDLHSAKPEPPANGVPVSYQNPRRGIGVTIVFKIQYIPGEDDLVTVWLNPDLGPGANEASQPESLTTRCNADASFDEIRLRHAGRGGGWAFSDLAIATSFSDFVDSSSARPGEANLGALEEARAISFDNWQKEQGLPTGPIRAIAQTAEGYLWVGSDEGLARFDGLRFVNFWSQQGLKARAINALLGDSSGALWLGGANSGLSCWRTNHLANFTTGDGLPSNEITALTEDAGGRIWVGTGAGLILCQNGRLLRLKSASSFEGRRINALFRDRQNRIWVGVRGAGVFRFENGQFTPWMNNAGEDLLKNPRCLLIDYSGRTWIGGDDNVVLCLENDQWRHYRIPHGAGGAYISSLAEEPDGTVWAASQHGGLLRFREGKPVALPAGTGLAGGSIQVLFADRAGGLWVGADGVLNHLHRKSLFSLSQSEGLGFGAAQGLAEVMPGMVWAAKANGGLYRWDGRSFSRLPAAGLSPHDAQVTALLVTHEGFCWVATTNRLLLYKDPIAAADEVTVLNPPAANIIALAEDRAGRLWVGTREGKLLSLCAGKWQAQPSFCGTAAITAIVPDGGGSLWIGTGGSGLYRAGNGTFLHFGKSEGLPSESIRTMALDAQGVLWIAATDAGLIRWKNGRASQFTPREGLADNSISQIVDDGDGRLWLGASRGIICVRKRRLEDLAAGRIPNLNSQLFGRTEGMLSEECTGGFFPAGLKTKSGLLWFSTLKGVVIVNPKMEAPASAPPNTVLEQVLLDGAAVRVPQTGRAGAAPLWRTAASGTPEPEILSINPGRHRLEFRYTGLSFSEPDRIRFRYRLEGLDADWVDAGTRRSAFYSYLPPGDYVFRVTSCGTDGLWSGQEARLGLTVLRHFWQAWWFLAFSGLGLTVSMAGGARLVEKHRLQRRLKRLEQERALERERSRIARDLHDEMGAKLCRISFLSEHARQGQLPPEELNEHISSISAASREVLHSLDEIVWAVNPQNDTLEHLASYIGQYAEEYFQMTGIQCELDIPTRLPQYPLSSQTRHNLFLAAHEALTNILKHSGATCARISMACTQAAFELVISDNGKSFDAAPGEGQSEPAAALSGDGLNNMTRRLADIGGHCEITSAPGQGVRVRFSIPLPAHQPES